MEPQFYVDPNPKKTERLNTYELVLRTSYEQGVGGTKNYTWNLDSDIVEASQYREIVTCLRTASPSTTFEIHITCWGGYLSTAMMLIDELLKTKAKTKAVIHTAASAATLIAFACDEVEAFKFSTIMLHNFSVTQHGKGSEVRAKAEFDERQFNLICQELYQGILSPDEQEALQDDKDVWMSGDELLNRMSDKNWTPMRRRNEL